jgi:propionyl-CoA carboxylase alpha chain
VAARRLAAALDRLVAPGAVTNRDFLVNVLRHPAFLAGDTTTDFIERHRPALRREVADEHRREAALAAALAAQVARRAHGGVGRTIPSGWRNNPSALQDCRYDAAGREVTVGYRRERDGAFTCAVDGVAAQARIVAAALPHLDLEIDGVRRAWSVTFGPGGTVFVQDAHGEVVLRERPRFPEPGGTDLASGGYAAPMPGKVLDVRVVAGAMVRKGQLLLVLEAMKMEHQMVAATDGIVTEVRAAAGQQVDVGQVLLVIEPPEEARSDGG